MEKINQGKAPVAPRDKVFVVVDQLRKDTIKMGNVELAVDPMINRTKYIAREATVVSVPKYVSWGIVPEIKVGDRIYMHFNALDRNEPIFSNGINYYGVLYDMIICAMRDGEIIMSGGRVLCKPIVDESVEISPTGVTEKKTSSGIIYDIGKERHNLKKAIVHKIGTPHTGKPVLGVKEGDVVYYLKDADWVNLIDGEEYFVMTQDDLIAVEEK